MGLKTKSGAGKMFLSIFSGDIVVNYDVREDLERRVEALGLDVNLIKERKKQAGKNEGQTVYYYVFDLVGGMIDNISIVEPSWGGETLHVIIKDVDEVFDITLGDIYSRHSRDFIRRLGNLDVNKEVDFGAWQMEEGDKVYSGVKLYQDNNKIDYSIVYTDLPKPTQKKRGSKITWDFTKQENFLYYILDKFIQENFGKVKAEPIVEKKTKRSNKPSNSLPKGADDVPF